MSTFLTPQNGTVVAMHVNPLSPAVRFGHSSPEGLTMLTFGAAPGQALTVGSYEGTLMWWSGVPGAPQLEIAVEGRACQGQRGRFVVHEIVYAADGVTAERFAADFDNYCEYPPHVRLWGAIRFNSSVPYANPTLTREGRGDLIWRPLNESASSTSSALRSGPLWATHVRGNDLSAARRIAADVGDGNWKIVGSDDVDRDGFGDLVFQHAVDGRVAFWLMDGVRRREGELCSPTGTSDPDWRVVAVGDLNGDAAPDLIWQHMGDGRVAVWFMNGTQHLAGQVIAQVDDLQWRIAAVGDLDGDARPDFLWRHRSTGHVAVWIMDGTRQVSGSLVVPEAIDVGWALKGLTDANGDGMLDMIWYHTALHRAAVWFMNRLTRISGELITTPVGAPSTIPGNFNDGQWEIVAVR